MTLAPCYNPHPKPMSLTHKYADIELEEAILSLLDSSMDTALEQTADFPSEEAATVKRLAKIGLKSESFAREALDLAKIYEGLMPRALDLERFERTIAQRDAIRARLRKAQLLVQRLQVLSVLLGVDCYSDALDVYHHLKRHGRGQEMRAVVKHLGRIFKRGKKEEPVEEEAPAGNETYGTDGRDEPALAQAAPTAAPMQAAPPRPPAIAPATDAHYPSHPSHEPQPPISEKSAIPSSTLAATTNPALPSPVPLVIGA